MPGMFCRVVVLMNGTKKSCHSSTSFGIAREPTISRLHAFCQTRPPPTHLVVLHNISRHLQHTWLSEVPRPTGSPMLQNSGDIVTRVACPSQRSLTYCCPAFAGRSTDKQDSQQVPSHSLVLGCPLPECPRNWLHQLLDFAPCLLARHEELLQHPPSLCGVASAGDGLGRLLSEANT